MKPSSRELKSSSREEHAPLQPFHFKLSRLAQKILQENKALEIWDRALARQALDRSQAEILLERGWPLISIFAELLAEQEKHDSQSLSAASRYSAPEGSDRNTYSPLLYTIHTYRGPINCLVHPCVYYPLSANFNKVGAKQAQSELESYLEQELISAPAQLKLFIDSWTTNYGTEPLLELLSKLKLHYAQSNLTLVGPSTRELLSILERDTKFSKDSLLSALQTAGVNNIEGGGNVELHQAALSKGFTCHFAHNINRERIFSSGPEGAPKAEAFLSTLFKIRDQLLPLLRSEEVPNFSYSPWTPYVLDKGLPRENIPLGLEMLSAGILAQLLLPELSQFRAPLSLFGRKLSELAVNFAARDLGFFAINNFTAESCSLERVCNLLENSDTAMLTEIYAN